MRLVRLAVAALASVASATILQNGQVRPNDYPNTAIASISSHNTSWETYKPDAPELSYKGRWDHQHISWWYISTILTSYFYSDRSTGQHLASSSASKLTMSPSPSATTPPLAF